MAKRGNHEGSISKRPDGRWEARLTLPDGRRPSFYGKTRAEVSKRLADARHDLEQGLPLISGRQTVESFLREWIELVQLEVKPSTWQRYRNFCLHQLIPGLGKYSLARLEPKDVQLFYQRQSKVSAPATLRQMHIVFHRALKDALRLGLVSRNVAEQVRAPRGEAREITMFSEEQARTFLEACAGDRFEALYVLALTTGMREGELIALHWADVDLERGKVQVRLSYQASGKAEQPFHLAAPKTAHSKRTILLSQRAIGALRAHKKQQNEHRLHLGHAWHDQDLLFPNTIGNLITPSIIVHDFQRKLAKLHLPMMRFHDLRHAAASIALAHGTPIQLVSEMLGHSDIAITLRVYGHLLPSIHGAAAEAMDRVFGG